MADHASAATHATGATRAMSRDDAVAAFKKIFRTLAPYKHRYEVFRDFVTMAAISLHNGLMKDPTREAEYMGIIKGYKPDDQKAFPKLVGSLIAALDHEPRDILGPLYMELEIANKDAGQFFTPPELSEVMAAISFQDMIDKLDQQPFIKLSEPACGAGGMILAFVKVLIQHKYNPSDKLWVQCVDVDRMAALMCYIQLTLWNVPAEVIVGNTLTWEHREIWYTPAHHLGFWANKLKREEGAEEWLVPESQDQSETPDLSNEPAHTVRLDEAGAKREDQTTRLAIKPAQLGFDF